MYKLMILIEPQDDWLQFEQQWPEFLKLAEQMPGLRREAASRVDRLLYGHYHVAYQHDLYFDSMQAAMDAMASKEGQKAGEVLQRITKGNVTLLIAQHLEDEFENITAHPVEKPSGPPGDKA